MFAVRSPGEAALSMMLAHIQGFFHIYRPEYIKDIHRRRARGDEFHKVQLFKNVLESERLHAERGPISIDIDALSMERVACIGWNHRAIMQGPVQGPVLDYGSWSHDPAIACKMLGISDQSRNITFVRDEVPLLERVRNTEEVAQFLQDHREEDAELLGSWLSHR